MTVSVQSRRFGFAKLVGLKGFEYFIRNPTVILGRSPDVSSGPASRFCPLTKSKMISRNHARIFFNVSRLRFEISCLCKNDIFVDKKMVSQWDDPAPLHDESTICIGDILLVFQMPINFQEQCEKFRKLSNCEILQFDTSGKPPRDSGDRPKIRTADIVKKAIQSSPLEKLTLDDIYKYIEKVYSADYPRWVRSGVWHTAVRTALANARYFTLLREPRVNGQNETVVVESWSVKHTKKSRIIRNKRTLSAASLTSNKRPRSKAAATTDSSAAAAAGGPQRSLSHLAHFRSFRQFGGTSMQTPAAPAGAGSATSGSTAASSTNPAAIKQQQQSPQTAVAVQNRQRQLQQQIIQQQQRVLQQQRLLQYRRQLQQQQWSTQYQQQLQQQQFAPGFVKQPPGQPPAGSNISYAQQQQVTQQSQAASSPTAPTPRTDNSAAVEGSVTAGEGSTPASQPSQLILNNNSSNLQRQQQSGEPVVAAKQSTAVPQPPPTAAVQQVASPASGGLSVQQQRAMYQQQAVAAAQMQQYAAAQQQQQQQQQASGGT
eukprot:14656_1